MIKKRHPACRSFQETEFQTRKSFGNFAGDEITKTDDRREVRGGKGAVELEIEEIEEVPAALPGVNADRQAQVFRCGVNWQEMRIIEGQRTDDTAEENSDGAVLFGLVHLLDGRRNGSERQHRDPAKPAVGSLKDLGQILIVRTAERSLQFAIVRYVNEKQRGIDNLHGDAGFVHVRQPCRNVGDLAAAESDIGTTGFTPRSRRSNDAKAAFA